jgi:plastocyanin
MHNSRFTKIKTVLVVAAVAVALSACGSDDKESSADTKATGSAAGITIKDFTFTASPVKAGSTVTVTNNDTTTHTVTSDDTSSFDVTVDAGKSATFTAPKAGTYAFHCNIHTQMKSTLTVT